MAWRPWYQPQLPQTTWGSFVALQRGHVLRGAASRVQFEARRLRLLAFDVFFFGTAMVSYPVDFEFTHTPMGVSDTERKLYSLGGSESKLS